MRLPRMTTRRWMVIVVIVGVVMGAIVGGVRLKRRHSYFLARVQSHAEREDDCRERKRLFDALEWNSAAEIEWKTKDKQGGSPEVARAKRTRALVHDHKERATRGIAYHAAMAQKYRYAARYPWFPVEPDPPEPEPPD
jgi:hypothetical protein